MKKSMTHDDEAGQGKAARKKKKYSIGQIAELCNISKKQLRYYDQNGILAPRHRAPGTRYRYYTEEQIEEVLLFQELKALDFPLKDIGQMISNRQLAALQRELEKRLYQLREDLNSTRARYDQTMDILLRINSGMAAKSDRAVSVGEIKRVEFAKRMVVYSRYVSHWNAESLFIDRRAELVKLARDHAIRITGANMAVFHSGYLKQFSDFPEDMEGDLEVCLNIAGQGSGSPHCRALGPFQAVSGIYIGHYRDMRPSYIALEDWARKNRIELAGVSVEEYLIGATMTNTPDDYVTRIYLPVKGSVV